MSSGPPLRVELVSHGGRDEAAKGLISLAVMAAMVGIQWWSFTPEAERMVKLRKLGITRCREGRWHLRGALIAWPPQRCLCAWPIIADSTSQAVADSAEDLGITQ